MDLKRVHIRSEPTENNAFFPDEFGTAVERRGADRSTSGVNLVAQRVIVQIGVYLPGTCTG